jgi:cell shape-determining protein MreC
MNQKVSQLIEENAKLKKDLDILQSKKGIIAH